VSIGALISHSHRSVTGRVSRRIPSGEVRSYSRKTLLACQSRYSLDGASSRFTGNCTSLPWSAEQDSPQHPGPIQQLLVAELARVVLLRRKNGDPSQPEALGDLSRHMDVHVQPDAQRSRPFAFSRVTSGDSAAASRNRRTCSLSLAMTLSSSAW